MLQFASLCFDASVEEIFPCLARGGAVVLRTDEMLGTTARFWQRCAEWGITVLSLPTAYWHTLCSYMETDASRSPASLRLVIIGGERALPRRLCAWNTHVRPGVRRVNSYGPTEATVVATMCDLPPEARSPAVVPIGRPLSNVETFVLDTHLQPVPVGVPGELFIGAVGPARGYLNQPGLTAQKFVQVDDPSMRGET